MFHELLSRDREDGLATGQPHGVGPEAHLNGKSQGTTTEDARKDGHIYAVAAGYSLNIRAKGIRFALRAGSWTGPIGVMRNINKVNYCTQIEWEYYASYLSHV